MKRYLLAGIIFLSISANASIKEDFTEMDEAQEQLLNDLRASVSLNADKGTEEIVEEVIVPKVDEEAVEEGDRPPTEETQEEVAHALDVEVNESPGIASKKEAEEKLNAMRARVVAAAKAKDKAQRDTEHQVKEEALKAEREAKKAEARKVKEAEAAAKAQREAEKREVEAYEKERAQKLAQKAAEEAVLEKKILAQKVLEEEALKKDALKQEALAREAAKKQQNIEKINTEKTKKANASVQTEQALSTSSADDVNITRELEEATKKADGEYDKAVKEMQKED